MEENIKHIKVRKVVNEMKGFIDNDFSFIFEVLFQQSFRQCFA